MLPCDNAAFDIVICVDVLEHIADLKQTIHEIHRVLKPAGDFCFDTINRTFQFRVIIIWLLEDLLHEIPEGIHDWEKFITPGQLTLLMQTVGFRAIEMKGFNVFEASWRD